MVALYLTSSERGSGKTAVGAGLGKHLLNDGKKIGYLKPVIASKAEGADNDAELMKHLFALEEPLDLLCPAFRNESELESKIKETYAKVSSGKDAVIIEGSSATNRIARQIVTALGAKVIIIEGYSRELAEKTKNYADFGESLLGVVLNKVPRSQWEQVTSEIVTSLSRAGVNILGVLPEDRSLVTLSVGELADALHGEILNSAEKSAELVENFMLGAMCIDSGPIYFSHKVNKAAVIRSERPDMQLAALETLTRCLVLTGKEALRPVVRQQAKAKNVPIILAGDEPATVAIDIEEILGRTKFNQEKLPKLIEIMERYFDFGTVPQWLD
ncbi:MAG: phosphotransacetylase family protein [Chloroflexi bacterium]|nr:phosphotransacetylase family protein [Chloroflexota bacterium]